MALRGDHVVKYADKEYTVIASKDSEAELWVGTCAELPGLVVENESIDGLISDVKELLPKFFELSEMKTANGTVTIMAVAASEVAA